MAEFANREASIRAEMDRLAAGIAYRDPADQETPPEVVEHEKVWFEDAFPDGAKVLATGHALTYSDDPRTVFSGKRSIKRSAEGIGQDFFESSAASLVVPPEGEFFVHVFLDPEDPPEEIMLQFNVGGWRHRAFWGKDVIPWGTAGTGERYAAGPLPESGRWIRLEVAAENVDLAPGTHVQGFAFTVQDGTVYFDRFGVTGKSSPATDPNHSLSAWRKSIAGKSPPGTPADLKELLEAGPARTLNQDQLSRIRSYYLQSVCVETKPKFKEQQTRIEAIAKERSAYEAQIPSTFIWKDLPTPRQSFVMKRGEYDKPGEEVQPDTPAVLPPLTKSDPGGRATRLDLANWLVSPENPLTARVTVNRFWQQLFGVGLVKTSHDLGTQGELPSHPELLDWLAVWFQDEGWDVKKLMRLMLTSEAFRRSSSAPAELWRVDPENRFLARGPRLRLDAEQLRDAALLSGGLLSRKMGGRGVNTYQPPNIWEPVGYRGSNTAIYKRDNGESLYRRSIYTFLKRTAPAPFLSNFDAPNREQSCSRRERSNTPLQALQLLNDVQYFEAARGLATRMMSSSTDATERLSFAYQTVLSRLPSQKEIDALEKFYRAQLTRYRESPADAAAAIRFGDSKPPAGIDEADLAAWTQVANLILNLDEAIVRN